MWQSAIVAAMLFAPAIGVGAPIAGSAIGGGGGSAASRDDPKLRVKLSDDELVAGDKAKVKVKASNDGYLIVLRRDTEGNVKVLYPVDPTDTAMIRRGKEIEIRSRGDREAFTVAERAGNGTVLAARSDRPFNFSAFTTSDRWSGSALTPDSTKRDNEEVLLSVVDRMSDGAHFDYDVTSYHVLPVQAHRAYANRMYGARYLGWYDPFSLGFYSTWPYYYPYYGYSSYGFGPSIGFGTYVHIGRGFPRGRGRR